MRKKTIPSNDLIKVEGATATAALGKVGHTSRRKLLTTGAGLVASAGAPAGIGALALALPTEAQATRVFGTLGSKTIIWQSGTSQSNIGGKTFSTSNVMVRYRGTIEYGTYEETITPPNWLGWGASIERNFEAISQALCIYSKAHKDFIVQLKIRDKVIIKRRRDKLLNSDTCDASWSKSTTTFQHRRLDDEETPNSLTPEQLRIRNEVGALNGFYKWIIYTRNTLPPQDDRLENGLAPEIRNIIRYVNHRGNNPAQGEQNLEPGQILRELFEVVDFVSSPTIGNSAPINYRATIRRRGTDLNPGGQSDFRLPNTPTILSTDNTYFINTLRNHFFTGAVPHPGNPDPENPDPPGRIWYFSLVFRYSRRLNSGISYEMPWGPGNDDNQPTTPFVAGSRARANEIRGIAAEMNRDVSDEDIRGAVWGAQSELLRENLTTINRRFVAPFIIASMLVARQSIPKVSTDSADLIPIVFTALLARSAIDYVINSAIDISNYLNGIPIRLAEDVRNGWAWGSYFLDDNEPADRRILGYTYDYNGGSINPNWTIVGSISGVSLDHSINEGVSYVAGLPAAAVKDQKIRVKFKLSPQVFVLREFVISVSHASSAELGILVNGKKLYIQGEPDWGKRIYKITAKIASNPDDNPSPPPAVKRWTIKMNHNPVISSQAEYAGGTVFTSVPSSCAEGDSLTIRFQASGSSTEVTFRIAEPQLKTYNVFIAQPPQRFQVSATKDDATKTYTISAWLTRI